MFRTILSPKVSRILIAGLGLGLAAACLPAAQGAESHAAVPPVANRPVVSVPITKPITKPTTKPTPKSPTVKPTLLIYGDSLTVLSEGAVNVLYGTQYHVVFRAFGGTSLCDWTAHAAQDRAEVHPTRVVIAFTGNAASCSRDDLARGGVTAWLANYQRSLLSMRRTFSGLPISVVGSPAVRQQTAGTWYPENGNPLLNQMYRQMCAQYGMHYNASADETLSPGHVFQWQRPAFPGNGPLTTVRAPDGVHVLPAGALYYADALGGE